MCANSQMSSTTVPLSLPELHQMVLVSRNKLREQVKLKQVNIRRNMLVVHVLKSAAKQYQDSVKARKLQAVPSPRSVSPTDSSIEEDEGFNEGDVEKTGDLRAPVTRNVKRGRFEVQTTDAVVPQAPSIPQPKEYQEEADFFSF